MSGKARSWGADTIFDKFLGHFPINYVTLSYKHYAMATLSHCSLSIHMIYWQGYIIYLILKQNWCDYI